MKTIWKQQIIVADVIYIHVPQGSEFLCVKVQMGVITLWYKCDPSPSTVQRRIYIVGTGHTRQDLENAKYLDTIMSEDHGLVLHFFEEPERKEP